MNLTIKLCLSAGLGSITLFNSATADNHQFSYLETQYAQVSHSDIDTEAGLGIELSLPFSDNWYVTGSNTQNQVTSDLGIEMDYTQWFLGVGHFWNLSAETDIYLQLSAETQKLEADLGQIDRRGASIEFGSHYRLTDDWMLEAYGRYSDINISEPGDRNDEFYFGARLDYQFTQNFNLGIGYESGDFSRSELALRFNF